MVGALLMQGTHTGYLHWRGRKIALCLRSVRAFPPSDRKAHASPQIAVSPLRWQQAEEKGQWLNLWLTTKRRVCESEKRH